MKSGLKIPKLICLRPGFQSKEIFFLVSKHFLINSSILNPFSAPSFKKWRIYGCAILFAFCCLGCWGKQQKQVQQLPLVKSPLPGCETPQKIVVHKENVYDLSGYKDEGKGSPYNLFDENDFVDPRSENKIAENYIPVTDPQPTAQPAIYFPKGKGNRIVVDLQSAYQISEAYLYDRSNSYDSIWIYTGDMLHWNLKAALVTVGSSRRWGWRKFLLNDSSRFVMIRFESYEKAITELVLYGCPYAIKPIATTVQPTMPRFSKTMMKDFLGVNNFQQVSTKWAKPFHYLRLYSFAVDFDNDIVNPYPQNKYNMLHFVDWGIQGTDYSFFFDSLVTQNNCTVWCSIRGLPASANEKQFQDNRPVTLPGMDPENPLSYARHSNMMWNIAAYFGKEYVDTNLVRLSHPYKKHRKGVMEIYENGNEEDAIWIGEKYQSPMAYFAQSSADYDGHEGRLPKNCGIKNADSASKLMTSGLIELDTNRIRVYKFLCNTLRKDKKFIWDGGIQYHHYSTNGKHGISPEEDSMRSKLAKVRVTTFKITAEVPVFLGENGYDKNQQTRQATPMLPGYNEEQSQAVFILRSINATAFSGFDAYILYWLMDNDPPENNNVYLTCGVLRRKPDGSTEPYISWFYISSFVNALANYMPDDIISENGNVWVYKYRNKLAPDSVAYFAYCPTHNGTKMENYPLKVGNVHNQEARQLEFMDSSEHGKETNLKISNGLLSISVDEKPKIILIREEKNR